MSGSPEISGQREALGLALERAEPWGDPEAQVLQDHPSSLLPAPWWGQTSLSLKDRVPLGSAGGHGTWIQRSLRFSVCGQTVSLQPAFRASSATASTKHVLFLTLQTSPGRVAQERAGSRGQRDPLDEKGTQCPRTHRHTYTSSGGRVLGVMTQGATRNTTVSVKMGASEKS